VHHGNNSVVDFGLISRRIGSRRTDFDKTIERDRRQNGP